MYPFRVGLQYTRRAIFEIVGVPPDTMGGKWFIGSARHHDDWFIFATVGDAARTGHDYQNRWAGDEFHWFGKTGSRIDQPTIQHMTSGQGRVYIFTRTDSRAPFTFGGLGTMVGFEDVVPVQIVWAVHDPSMAGQLQEGDGKRQTEGHFDDLNPAPDLEASDITEPPERIPSTVNRIIRDTARSRQLKLRYQHCCQVCRARLEIGPERYYCEVHHIRPLGGGHQGLDREDNMIVLCPNHHAIFDFGGVRFLDENKVEIGGEVLGLLLLHSLSHENIAYHNTVLALIRSE